ncbi:DNA polymerase zeta catalytic subunit [Episyrphus balteatus]|uniref:DNA polymerase zeta catalytic subunit n=1 Tax=Episyrphus balteatus TaxID=286459 RepID=UPI00248596B5|nr:DNA polymerase zeta catalytic subunit [Episyrphus balteatus]
MPSADIFSLRIVTADFYMEKPKPGLDPCFSEFRAKEIKKVPVIRIFGSTSEGVKSCMHVHGVFPYLYIPFDKKNFETLDKASYLIASSLDKAINISLGQSSAESHHVFKIQLVKGIPFYGYHANEHQFIKIYMFNPRFVRRAANLLQNGAIMGKTFHAHESHVPYILQFFIDYNLYGMSFLHVPKEVLKFRRNKEDDAIPYSIAKEQILDCSLAVKQSTSKLELDIISGFILNRFQLHTNTSTHANPGIEAIWQDEKIRRDNLSKDTEKVPPLETPLEEQRPNVKPTSSEEFYRIGLVTKLEQLEMSLNETISDTPESNKSIVPEKKQTFNLKKLLANAVYPEECSQDDLLTNASFIPNHFSSGSIFESSIRFSKSDSIPEPDNSFMDDTIVDEDLIRCITQPDPVNKTLREEDMELLDVMQQLEEEQDENNIDLDSTLAPLSQNINFNNSQHVLRQKLSHNNSSEDESDNECQNDFTMVMDDMDELLIKLSQPSLPDVVQFDGADDILNTPKKKFKSKLPNTPIHVTPKRMFKPESPRTPKSTAKKYEPLPLIINSRSVKKNLTNASKQMEVDSPRAVNNDLFAVETDKSPNRRKTIDLDKTHITCQLRPRIRKSEVRLKTYNTPKVDCEPDGNKSTTKRKRSLRKKNEHDKSCSSVTSISPKVHIKRFSMVQKLNEITQKKQHESKEDKMFSSNSIEKNQSQSLKLSSDEISSISSQISPDGSNLNSTRKLRKTGLEVNRTKCSPSKVRNQNVSHISSKSSVTVQQPSLYIQSKMKENAGDLEISLPEQNQSLCEKEVHNVREGNINTDKCSKQTSFSRKRRKLPLKSKKLFEGNKIDQQSLENVSIGEKDLRSVLHDSYDRSSSRFIAKKLRINIKKLKINEVLRSQIDKSHKQPNLQVCNIENKVSGSSRSSKDPLGELLKDAENDHIIDSFCERSFIMNNTLNSDFLNVQNFHNSDIIIKPKMQTETYCEVKNNYRIHGIPDMVNQQPFYSNYADVTSRKEVGHTLLWIPGVTLNDVEEFKSKIPTLESFSDNRKKMAQDMTIKFRNDACIKKYLSDDTIIIATPSKFPPNKEDAKIWLKAKELLKRKNLEEDKTKIKESVPTESLRRKVLMDIDTAGDLEDADCSMQSISLTPFTPVKSDHSSTDHINPLTNSTDVKSVSKGNTISQNQCLSKDLEVCSVFKPNYEDKMMINKETVKFNNKSVLKTTQEDLQSGMCSSATVMAELGKVTFVNNLHNSQGSFDSSFGISHASLNNTFGFKVNLENLHQAKSDIEHNYLTTLSLEIFVSTRENLLPNPQFDAISCIFYAIENSIPSSENSENLSKTSGLIIISDGNGCINTKLNGIDPRIEIKIATNELDGFAQLLNLCAFWDPDIFVGYEIEMSSWGYVMERAKHLDFNIAPLLSRVPTQNVRGFNEEERDQLTDLDVESKLCGRILLDVWRLMRSEIALTSYTFENVMYHILHRRCPIHTYADLSKWFRSPQTRWIVFEYFLDRVHGTLELLDQLDLIGRTSEMAKLIGIQFYEVLSRGSQFRVESMMLRIAKPKNLVPLSPSVQQRAHMRAPEYLPLILEPQSRFYPDPIIVLDFQSLYPSMIMAYNYCFSTCLGRVEHLGQSTPFEFGASQLRVSPTLIKKLLKNDMITISPCGIAFIKKNIREGVLPRMLKEILDTRQMVKQSMKLHKTNSALQRILHSRQLGLKLIANVTYGYTAANFSGRMPCVEVGDSVVAKGRETLERAIKLVETNEEWNVKVVYGDTDSMFVLVPGRSKTEAFRIGSEIAESVTKDNPQPVKLKLEKVYQPCILQTKKRYVGYMFESPDQKEPIFEAKGIETVRRDGCPAAVKMLEKTLKILFDTADVSEVKKYICRQFTKLLSGKANIQDLLFAKEFRGLKGYKPTACVPALELARKWMQLDPRRVPRSGERVQFIITNGPPGVPLIKLVRSPDEVLADEGLKINAIYYITKAIIPPLNRCLLLIGADVNEWFASLPRKILFNTAITSTTETVSLNAIKKSTISQYFSSTKCIVDCGQQTKQGICSLCSLDVSNTVVSLEEKISKLQRGYYLTQFICQSCCGRPNFITCTSFDCPVLYVLEMKKRDLAQVYQIRSTMNDWLQTETTITD